MQQLTPNTLLQGGKYKIVRHISSGGFGNTYEGVYTMMDTRVAIKEFYPNMFCNRELVDKLRKKFIEEAKTLSQMNHPNIVKVHDIFEENGTAYYVMDYIDGESLTALLKHRGSLPEKEAVAIILKVADALGYMHKQNRFHLDVKPASIMICKDGDIVLLSNFSSRLYTLPYEEYDGHIPYFEAIDCYKAIEQYNGNPALHTASTDIYALGAILYMMVTGSNPPLATALANEGTSLTFSGEISKKVKLCISKSMMLYPRKRLQSIEEFVDFLKDMSAELCEETDEEELRLTKRHLITAVCTQKSVDRSDRDYAYLGHDLEVGKEYEVQSIDVALSNTTVRFKGRPGTYNIVYLLILEDGKPIDVLNDRRFNPYIEIRERIENNRRQELAVHEKENKSSKKILYLITALVILSVLFLVGRCSSKVGNRTTDETTNRFIVTTKAADQGVTSNGC